MTRPSLLVSALDEQGREPIVNPTDAIVLQVALDPQLFARYLMRPDEMGREVSRDLDEASR
jgi:hypothetical protein